MTFARSLATLVVLSAGLAHGWGPGTTHQPWSQPGVQPGMPSVSQPPAYPPYQDPCTQAFIDVGKHCNFSDVNSVCNNPSCVSSRAAANASCPPSQQLAGLNTAQQMCDPCFQTYLQFGSMCSSPASCRTGPNDLYVANDNDFYLGHDQFHGGHSNECGSGKEAFNGRRCMWANPNAYDVTYQFCYPQEVELNGITFEYDAGATVCLEGTCQEFYKTNGDNTNKATLEIPGVKKTCFQLRIDSRHSSWNWIGKFVPMVHCENPMDWASICNKSAPCGSLLSRAKQVCTPTSGFTDSTTGKTTYMLEGLMQMDMYCHPCMQAYMKIGPACTNSSGICDRASPCNKTVGAAVNTCAGTNFSMWDDEEKRMKYASQELSKYTEMCDPCMLNYQKVGSVCSNSSSICDSGSLCNRTLRDTVNSCAGTHISYFDDKENKIKFVSQELSKVTVMCDPCMLNYQKIGSVCSNSSSICDSGSLCNRTLRDTLNSCAGTNLSYFDDEEKKMKFVSQELSKGSGMCTTCWYTWNRGVQLCANRLDLACNKSSPCGLVIDSLHNVCDATSWAIDDKGKWVNVFDTLRRLEEDQCTPCGFAEWELWNACNTTKNPSAGSLCSKGTPCANKFDHALSACTAGSGAPFEAIRGKGCSSYIHMDDMSWGNRGGQYTVETCAAAVKANAGRDGCTGQFFFFETAGWCNCPRDACIEAAENQIAGGAGMLFKFTEQGTTATNFPRQLPAGFGTPLPQPSWSSGFVTPQPSWGAPTMSPPFQLRPYEQEKLYGLMGVSQTCSPCNMAISNFAQMCMSGTAGGAGAPVKVPFNWEPPNTGLSWSSAKAQAAAMGGRLPYAYEMRSNRISDGNFDQWQPVEDSPGMWVQTGDAGRIYITEGKMGSGWYDTKDAIYARPTSESSTMGSGIHHFWVTMGASSTGPNLCDPTQRCGRLIQSIRGSCSMMEWRMEFGQTVGSWLGTVTGHCNPAPKCLQISAEKAARLGAILCPS